MSIRVVENRQLSMTKSGKFVQLVLGIGASSLMFWMSSWANVGVSLVPPSGHNPRVQQRPGPRAPASLSFIPWPLDHTLCHYLLYKVSPDCGLRSIQTSNPHV